MPALRHKIQSLVEKHLLHFELLIISFFKRQRLHDFDSEDFLKMDH